MAKPTGPFPRVRQSGVHQCRGVRRLCSLGERPSRRLQEAQGELGPFGFRLLQAAPNRFEILAGLVTVSLMHRGPRW